MNNRLIFGCLFLGGCFFGCKDPDIPPVAHLSANSHFGYPGRVFTFSASESIDADNNSLGLECRWDFESDGIWDTYFSQIHEVNYAFPNSGTYTVTLEVMDQTDLTDQMTDTIFIYGRLPDSSMTDPRDQQTYRIVKINGLWIMAENLRYGVTIPTNQEQTDNKVSENYAYKNDPANIIQYGGLYSWWEAMNYENHTNNQGICPPGWRIPDVADVRSIDIPASHYFIVDYYRSGGLSGLNIDFPGLYIDLPVSEEHNTNGPDWPFPGYSARYWSTYYHFQDLGEWGKQYKLGQFTFYASSNQFRYKGDGIALNPIFQYTDCADGFYQKAFISVRCVSAEF